jgi:sugar phosphate isomerase/epimerase
MNRHERIRRAGLDRAREMIDLAIDMGGEYFVLHPGRLAFYSLSTKRVFFMEQRFPEKIGATFADSLGALMAHCNEQIELCIENTQAFSSPFLNAIGEAAGGISPGLVWDVGHTEQLSGVRRQQLIRFFQDNIKRVRLAHLHDVVDGAVHKALGAGQVDVAGYLEIFNAMGIDVILEVFPEEGLIKSVEYLRTLVVTDKLNS